MFGGAGVVGLYAVGALTACLILALATAVTGWLATLIVAVVFGAVAGLLAQLPRPAGDPPTESTRSAGGRP